MEAVADLVRRWDEEAIRELTSAVGKLKEHTHSRAGWGTGETEARDMCELIAVLKLSVAEPVRGLCTWNAPANGCGGERHAADAFVSECIGARE